MALGVMVRALWSEARWAGMSTGLSWFRVVERRTMTAGNEEEEVKE